MSDSLPRIVIASDHAGFNLKGILAAFLRGRGYEVTDSGAFSFDEADDYPDFIAQAAHEISAHRLVRGIIIGGSGQGEAIVANRFSGVRAVVYYGGSDEIVKLSREHNDANVLSLGARFLSDDEAKHAVALWLDTPFSGEGRHMRRIEKIDAIFSGGSNHTDHG